MKKFSYYLLAMNFIIYLNLKPFLLEICYIKYLLFLVLTFLYNLSIYNLFILN